MTSTSVPRCALRQRTERASASSLQPAGELSQVLVFRLPQTGNNGIEFLALVGDVFIV